MGTRIAAISLACAAGMASSGSAAAAWQAGQAHAANAAPSATATSAATASPTVGAALTSRQPTLTTTLSAIHITVGQTLRVTVRGTLGLPLYTLTIDQPLHAPVLQAIAPLDSTGQVRNNSGRFMLKAIRPGTARIAASANGEIQIITSNGQRVFQWANASAPVAGPVIVTMATTHR